MEESIVLNEFIFAVVMILYALTGIGLGAVIGYRYGKCKKVMDKEK